MQAMLAAAALGVVTITAVAQSGGGPEDTGVAGPPRPKVDTVDTVTIEGAGYDLAVYIQQNKTVEDKDAHFYYTPLFYLVTDSENALRHHIDDSNVLTLKIKRDPDTEGIEEAVRKNLIKLAKETNPAFRLEEGTVPYRIDPLKMSKIVFTSDKRMDQRDGKFKKVISDPVSMSGVEIGEINVHFYLHSRDYAKRFVKYLEEGHVHLVLNYTFAGVADDVCEAKFEGRSTQSIDLYKKVTGAGGVGRVARHQAATIADEMLRSNSVVARCDDFELAEKLMDRLLKRLGNHENVKVASWEELDRLIAFDADSFKADVETSVNTQRKSVNRDQVLKALSEAYSSAKAKATKVGGKVGYGVFNAEMSADLADTRGKNKSEARKMYKDVLEKMGVLVDWRGNRYIPKSVHVHSKADLENAWGQTFEVKIVLTEGEVGGRPIHMTRESWENNIPSEHKRSIEKRLGRMEETVANMEKMSEQTLKISKRARERAIQAVNSSTRRYNEASIARRVAEEALSKAIEADIQAKEAISVEYCRYHLKNRRAWNKLYFYDFRRSDKVAILSGVDTNCPDRHFDVILARRSSTNEDWIVKIDDLDRECDWIRLDIVFMNGNSIGRSKHYNVTIPRWNQIPIYKYTQIRKRHSKIKCYQP